MKTKEVLTKESCMMRDVFNNTLVKIAGEDSRIVFLDADLMSSSGAKTFKNAFPERFFNVGIAEANMVGIAAGLARAGKVPFMHSFGPFATRRCFDQIFLSLGYNRLSANVIGTDPGVTAAHNGGTHMPFEDMGLMMLIPESVVIEPTDSHVLEAIIPQLIKLPGVHYIRLFRKNAIGIYEGGEFTVGKGVEVRPGTDVSIISSGIMVEESVKARDILAAEGVSARVVDMFTWKPIDRELIARCAVETGAIVTAENHNVSGGLGNAVAAVVAETKPVPMERIGVQDRFGQVGEEPFLREQYQLTAKDIVAAVKKAIARK